MLWGPNPNWERPRAPPPVVDADLISILGEDDDDDDGRRLRRQPKRSMAATIA